MLVRMNQGKKGTRRRILFYFISPSITGGANTGLVQLIRALPRDQYHLYLVVPREPTKEERTLLSTLVADIAVVPMSGWWTKNIARPWHRRTLTEAAVAARSLFYIRPVSELIRLIRKWHIDLVYTGSAMILDAALAAKLARKPHIWHIKEKIGKNGTTQFYLPDRLVVRLIDFLSSQVIVMGDFVAECFIRHGRTAKVIKIYDGVDPSDFDPTVDGKRLRRCLGIKDDELLVGLIASIGAVWKKHEIFIHMAAILKEILPQVRFIHFGHIPIPGQHSRHRYNALCRMIDDLGLSDRFIWGGVVTSIPEMMAALDLLVHPTDVEPFGRIAIEAMAAGRPIVGAAGGGIAESVVNGETGFLVPPDEPKAFAEAALRVLKDSHLGRRMGESGARRVRQQFSIDQHVKQMTEVFDSTI